MLSGRPDASEYPPGYARYVDLVPEDDICDAMVQQLESTVACLSRIPEAKIDWRYAPDKWTTREVVGHILDTERIFGFRLLTFARGDTVALPRADEKLYVSNADFGRYPLREWLEEFLQVGKSHCHACRPPASGRLGAERNGLDRHCFCARHCVSHGRPREASSADHSGEVLERAV